MLLKILDTTKYLVNSIQRRKVKISKQEQRILDLETQNNDLKRGNQETLSQIKEYIQELEQIRNHYVDSNNSPER